MTTIQHIEISNPDDPLGMPLYGGYPDRAHMTLKPGRYEGHAHGDGREGRAVLVVKDDSASAAWHAQTTEHTFLVAVTVETTDDDRQRAERMLHAYLGDFLGTIVTSWWVAEDDRQDGSDNDSAVFVRKGTQLEAHEALVERGVTAAYNSPAPRVEAAGAGL